MNLYSLAWRGVVLSVTLLYVGCGSPGQGPAGSPQAITGSERFGWDQAAADLGELATFRFVFYVDGVRSESVEATCGTAPGAAGFPCTCQLPAMAAGLHALQLAAYVDDNGTIRESERSAPLRVQKR